MKFFDRDFLVREFWERHAFILEKFETSSPWPVLILLSNRRNCRGWPRIVGWPCLRARRCNASYGCDILRILWRSGNPRDRIKEQSEYTVRKRAILIPKTRLRSPRVKIKKRFGGFLVIVVVPNRIIPLGASARRPKVFVWLKVILVVMPKWMIVWRYCIFQSDSDTAGKQTNTAEQD